jgi:outer membrane protein assembly factor BamB
VKWENRRGAPFVPSAILVGDYYYLIDDQGITSCLHAATGKRAWQKRLPGGYTASPVATRDHIYFANEGGKVTVIRAHTPRYQQVARNDIGEPIFASPSLASGDLFVRTPRHLWCIGGQTN